MLKPESQRESASWDCGDHPGARGYYLVPPCREHTGCRKIGQVVSDDLYVTRTCISENLNSTMEIRRNIWYSEEKEDVRTSYANSAKSELARFRQQLGDLKKGTDTARETASLEVKLVEINTRNNRITQPLNQRLRPHLMELRSAVAEGSNVKKLCQRLNTE